MTDSKYMAPRTYNAINVELSVSGQQTYRITLPEQMEGFDITGINDDHDNPKLYPLVPPGGTWYLSGNINQFHLFGEAAEVIFDKNGQPTHAIKMDKTSVATDLKRIVCILDK